MVDVSNLTMHQQFEEIFQTVPGELRTLDFDALDAYPSTRGQILKKFEEIVAPIRPNFLIGYSGHINFAVSLATNLNIACNTAYKIPIDGDPNDYTVYLNKHYLLRREQELGEKLRIVYIDDSAERGRAGRKLIQHLRGDGFEINDAIVLIEGEGKGGRESLAAENVKLHSLTKHSPGIGFYPGISGPEAEAFVKSAPSSSFGSPGLTTASQRFKRLPTETTANLGSRHTRSHLTRPGGITQNVLAF
jgi:adenine/guanine phosphoribosyltransferase-like PRPP-binding protein